MIQGPIAHQRTLLVDLSLEDLADGLHFVRLVRRIQEVEEVVGLADVQLTAVVHGGAQILLAPQTLNEAAIVCRVQYHGLGVAGGRVAGAAAG